jgi:hypothetical protein
MSNTISGELSISEKKADEIMNFCRLELSKKDTISEILQGFICSEMNTQELVFASYCLGGIMAKRVAEHERNEMQQLVELIKKITQ